MAVSKTDIANQALAYIGEPTIMNVNDKDNATARIVNSVYDITFREIARDHEWNCLKRRVEAALLTLAPVFGYARQFKLPSDFIRLLRLNGHDIQQRTDTYEIENLDGVGLVLLSDADVAKIQYIAEVEDTTTYDALFVEAFAVLLGSKIATQIRQDEVKSQGLYNKYIQVVLPRARKVDGNERNKQPFDPREQSRWLNARVTGTFQGGIDDL